MSAFIEITCRERTDAARLYVANLPTPQPFLCIKCGAEVPRTGDELHTVEKARAAS